MNRFFESFPEGLLQIKVVQGPTKTSLGVPVRSTIYIYEKFDEFSFPLGVNKEIISMSNKMGHIEATLKVVNDVSSKVIENSTVEKTTWKDKVVNSNQKQSKTSKNSNQGLLKSVGKGPRHFKKLHITSKLYTNTQIYKTQIFGKS